MSFTSLSFLAFFPIVCIAFWCIRGRHALQARNLLLLAASYYFYMCWKPVYALLLLASTAITYACALAIGTSQATQARRASLCLGVALNVLILFFFKYFNFAADNLQALFTHLGVSISLPALEVLLPVGISFYIFQAMGYLIDVYKGKIAVEHNFFTYALFVSFFPQMVAGPIERSTNLLPQFKSQRIFNPDQAISGVRLMIYGYFMKLCLADQCALYVDHVFDNPTGHAGFSSLLAAILFTFQIYGDFAGYTYISRGAARVMGFSLMENFRQPYFAFSITDFWHRWHISLTTWFRDYIYFPLGGSRCGKARTYANIITVFLISGIWHGAAWTYIAWGGGARPAAVR